MNNKKEVKICLKEYHHHGLHTVWFCHVTAVNMSIEYINSDEEKAKLKRSIKGEYLQAGEHDLYDGALILELLKDDDSNDQIAIISVVKNGKLEKLTEEYDYDFELFSLRDRLNELLSESYERPASIVYDSVVDDLIAEAGYWRHKAELLAEDRDIWRQAYENDTKRWEAIIKALERYELKRGK